MQRAGAPAPPKRKGEMGGSTSVCSVNSKRCTMARLLTANGFENREKPSDAVIAPSYLSNSAFNLLWRWFSKDKDGWLSI